MAATVAYIILYFSWRKGEDPLEQERWVEVTTARGRLEGRVSCGALLWGRATLCSGSTKDRASEAVPDLCVSR